MDLLKHINIMRVSRFIDDYNFCGFIFLKPLQIARYTLRINDFTPRASDLFSRIMTQGGDIATLTKQLSKKAFHCYPTVF